MKIIIDKPIFRGEYYTMDTPEERLILKKGCFTQKPFSDIDSSGRMVDYPARYYFVICIKQGNKFWQEAWTCPRYEDNGRWFQGLKMIDKIRNADEAYKLFIKSFNWRNKTIKTGGELKRFDAIMPRTEVPEVFKDRLTPASKLKVYD